MLTEVIETVPFQRSAKVAGMTEADVERAVDAMAANPLAGDIIVGAGGCRKVRVAGRGKGKSGGYRVITYFIADGGVYLLLALSKGKTANLTKGQVNVLAKVVKELA